MILPHHRMRRQRRRGYVLVLFAMLFWLLLGMAALVIDLGLARVKLRQAQSAVDTAALEAIRDSYETELSDEARDADRLFAQTLQYQPINWTSAPVGMDGPSIKVPSSEVRFESPDVGREIGPKIADPRKTSNYLSLSPPTYMSDATMPDAVSVTHGRNGGVPGAPGMAWLFGRAPLLNNEDTAYLVPQGIRFQAQTFAQRTPVLTMWPRDDVGELARWYAVSIDEWGWDNGSKPQQIRSLLPVHIGERFCVGDAIPLEELASEPLAEQSGYALIYDSIVGEDVGITNCVVGFGYFQFNAAEGSHTVDNYLAPANASSSLFLNPGVELTDVSKSLESALENGLRDTQVLCPALAPTSF